MYVVSIGGIGVLIRLMNSLIDIYRLDEVQPRHFIELATRAGVENLATRMRDFVESLDAAWDRVEASLPKDFPPRVYTRIRTESRSQAKLFLKSAPSR